MFLLGTLMGIGIIRRGFTSNQLQDSIAQWSNIDGEVLLLVFLPGLLFWDAFNVNFHLFQESFWQLLTMAFPMVLAGTVLTALIGYYVFPYGWSFNLSMTFGAILAATDPVAVSALLNEVGAPPRLKMHVSGESMLNDGSAVVFYTIFSMGFLAELGISGLGHAVDVGEGFAIFFRMSCGGALIGIAFGLGLMLLLFLLSRRLDNEENVLQVAATITVAYLSFYIAEVAAHCSGVIAVVACGITTQAFGSNMINDQHMMESFWILVEHLLNTVLFCLGGVVWGAVVADTSNEEIRFDAKDWGYLILLYVLLTLIRFFLVFAFYPLLSRIGLKSNWREAVFLSYSGLRGAVGIALALSLDNEVWHATDVAGKSFEYRDLTSTLFGMVGGVAFFTLVINGTFSGPLLCRLGLAKSSNTRIRILQHYSETAKDVIVDDFLHLMTEPRFHNVDFAVVTHHVPILRTLTAAELKAAVRRNKERVPSSQYKTPNLDNVMPYLIEHCGEDSADKTAEPEEAAGGFDRKAELAQHSSEGTVTGTFVNPRDPKLASISRSVASADLAGTKVRAIELRHIFIELLRYAYRQQVEKGELDGRGFLDYILFQSLEFASDEVTLGKPLNDWDAAQIVGWTWTGRIETFLHILYGLNCTHRADLRSISTEYLQTRIGVKRALAFVAAHQKAQECFQKEFAENVGEFSAAETLVIEESEAQVVKAKEVLQAYDRRDVEVIVSHLVCRILLNKGARYVEYLSKEGLMKPREAHHFLELVEEAIDDLKYCSRWKHPGELTKEEKIEVMRLSYFAKGSRELHCELTDNEVVKGDPGQGSKAEENTIKADENDSAVNS